MTRLPRFHVYLLLCRDDGRIYSGYTADLRQRFRKHNSPDNRGYTRGRRWHLLAVKGFLDRDTALIFERQLKRSRYDRRNWIRKLARREPRGRLRILCERHRIRSAYVN